MVCLRDMEMVPYFFAFVAGVALAGFFYFENKSIVTTKHRLSFEFLPKEFDGLTIVHLSDLHNTLFGKEQGRLVDAVRAVKPDIVVITGDIVDELIFQEEPVIALVRRLHDIAPIYYVSGNHEWSRPEYSELRQQLIDLGVHVLDNRVETIARGDAMLAIAGIDDVARHFPKPRYFTKEWFRHFGQGSFEHAQARQIVHCELDTVRQGIDERAFKILLVHRPEWLQEYMDHHFDLIFAGHAHGGQWDLPVLGPILAPGQGFFPKLVSGVHKRHGSVMVVSRGLGNSGIAFQRLFNRPEVVAVTLKKTA